MLLDMDDEALLEAWRAGDSRAGEQLYERHAEAVARFFENKIRVGVPDLIQQTFVGLIESRDRLRDPSKLRAYLLGIAFRVLREHLRKLARGREVNLDTELSASLEPGPSTMAARRREQRLVLEGLRRIPIRHQVVLELYYWEDLNAVEIAEIAGISHSGARTRLSVARKSLEQAIEGLANDPILLEATTAGLERWAKELHREARATAPERE